MVRDAAPTGGFRVKAESAFRAWKRKEKKKFLRILELFFLGLDGNRFRLADVGGVEPLRKLIRQKLVPGRGLEV